MNVHLIVFPAATRNRYGNDVGDSRSQNGNGSNGSSCVPCDPGTHSDPGKPPVKEEREGIEESDRGQTWPEGEK